MHVPDHGTHHRVKFRCKMSLYAPWTKMTNFWHEMRSKNMNLRSGNLSFFPRTHTMTFRSDISQGGACHGQVRAWFFSEFFEKFWKTKFAPQKSGSKCSREPRRISVYTSVYIHYRLIICNNANKMHWQGNGDSVPPVFFPQNHQSRKQFNDSKNMPCTFTLEHNTTDMAPGFQVK